MVVRVEDVNDQPPVFTAAGYEASVPENATGGTEVVAVAATDSDSETTSLEYFLQAGNVQGRFSLDRTLGLLSTRGTLDREETARYNLTVVASDGQLESSVQVIITITDVNDRHPIFPTNFYVVSELSESLPTGAEVLLLEAVDQDAGSNGWVSYSSPNLPRRSSSTPALERSPWARLWTLRESATTASTSRPGTWALPPSPPLPMWRSRCGMRMTTALSSSMAHSSAVFLRTLPPTPPWCNW